MLDAGSCFCILDLAFMVRMGQNMSHQDEAGWGQEALLVAIRQERGACHIAGIGVYIWAGGAHLDPMNKSRSYMIYQVDP